MKRLFISLFLFSILLSGCSKNDDMKEESKLEYIQIKVTSDDISAPNGNVYLFRLTGHNIDHERPIVTLDYTPVLSYKNNGERDYLTPISSYGKKSAGDLLLKDSYSIHSIYWDDLSTLNGTPLPGDEYMIYVDLRNGTYARSYKKFTLTKNSIITVKLPSCNKISEFVEGIWTIEESEI